MSRRREFEIAFVGLKPGIHEFNYLIDERFFEAFQQQDFRQCKAGLVEHRQQYAVDDKAGRVIGVDDLLAKAAAVSLDGRDRGIGRGQPADKLDATAIYHLNSGMNSTSQ